MCRQPAGSQNHAPYEYGHDPHCNGTRGRGLLRGPSRGLFLEHSIEIQCQKNADDYQRGFQHEGYIDNILCRFGHPQHEAADELQRERIPQDRKQPIQQRVRNHREQPEQAKSDDQNETDENGRPQRMKRQGQGPPPQLGSYPGGELRTLKPFEHCSIPGYVAVTRRLFQRNGNIRPKTITPAHASSATTATHLAATGALSPAFTFHSRVESEKYRTAIAPIEMNSILGANPASLTT